MAKELSIEEICRLGMKVDNWKKLRGSFWDYRGDVDGVQVDVIFKYYFFRFCKVNG